MIHYQDKELADNIRSHINASNSFTYFWFRDMCLDAERRGILSINKNESQPFWYDTSQVIFTEMGQKLLVQVDTH